MKAPVEIGDGRSLALRLGGGRRVSAWGIAELEAAARAIASWVFPFALVVYLAFKNGGYDVTIRSEVGIAIWWILLVGAVAGITSLARVRGHAWVPVAALALLAAWTGLGIAWSESAERSLIELARVVTLLGILVLALSLQGRDGLRRTIGAVTCAVGLVAVLALVSRLQPSWIPAGALQEVPGVGRLTRLNYPLNYWNGMAALMAIGIPLALTMAMHARAIAGQALSAAAVPVMVLVSFYTFSRGGAIAAAVGVFAFVAIYPRRLSALPMLLVTGAGSAIAVSAAAQRDALENGLAGAAAAEQGDEMLAVIIVVAAGVALLQAALGLARRHGYGPRVEVSPRATAVLAAGAALVALVGAAGAGLPETIDREWEEFKEPARPVGTGAARYESSVGSGRYQVWEEAFDANATAPLHGIGPGTYEFWWAEHGEGTLFVRDAHSLYFEALAELGFIGFFITVGFVAGVLGIGIARVRRASEEKRALLAGAVAACAAFAFAAGIDWAWELTVLPAIFCLLAAAIAGPAVVRSRRRSRRGSRAHSRSHRLSGSGRRRRSRRRSRSPLPVALSRDLPVRLGLGVAAALALVAIAIPYAGAGYVAESQKAAEADLGTALDRARDGRAVQPYAASPTLQEAVLREADGDLDGAAALAREATREESTNWRTWMTLSAIEARRGNAEAAVDAYRRARSLNPRSVLFRR